MEVPVQRNIRVKEAAHYVGLSKSSLDKMRHFGGGPNYFKLGRAVVYSTADLDAWMAARRRSETWDGANDNVHIAARAA
jgi:excisionase family DNA binding protein